MDQRIPMDVMHRAENRSEPVASFDPGVWALPGVEEGSRRMRTRAI
jgi:hypothetical protein